MNLALQAPKYQRRPIGSVESLALTLAVRVDELTRLAERADQLYRLAKPIVKPDGSIRRPFDALEPLKSVHRKIKLRILENVYFPPYLTGSLKGQDYVRNAEIHKGSRVVICEDIKSFFPSVGTDAVYDIWQRFFRFPPDVASLLAKLTTKDGALPQGAIPSSYLANLVLWRVEPSLHARLAQQGLKYSRYVDDIAVSSARDISGDEKTQIITGVYGMLASRGLKPKRDKHDVYEPGQRMVTTKLVVNTKVSLPSEVRSRIRAMVHRVELLSAQGPLNAEGLKLLSSVSVQVGQLQRLHQGQSRQLKERLAAVRHHQNALLNVSAGVHDDSLNEAGAWSGDAPW